MSEESNDSKSALSPEFRDPKTGRFLPGNLELTRFRGHQNMRVNHDAKDTQAVPQ
jgi:hypothetical protein